MRKRLLMVAVVLVAATALVFSRVIAQDSTKTTTETKTTTTTKTTSKTDATKPAASKFEYVGKDKCKLCHKQQFDSWMTTMHAKAWEALKPEEQKKDECMGCHSTGKDAAGTLLTGVQCEVCHGPGSVYKAQATMKDKKLAMAAGLTQPAKEICVRCHNEKSPTFKGFDFDKYIKDPKGIHQQFPKKTDVKKG
jgi:hypothetical protein